jgi:hypothetical protein
VRIYWTWPAWVSTVAPHAVTWPTLGAVLAPLVLLGVLRLFAEWQRRTTLLALLRHAPGGTVVIQEKGSGGPAMWILVGNGPRPPIVAPVIVLPFPRYQMVLAPGGHRE